MNFTGIIIGVATFFIIGLFHPIVIKCEYYFGVKLWWLFAIMGVVDVGVVDNRANERRDVVVVFHYQDAREYIVVFFNAFCIFSFRNEYAFYSRGFFER